MIIYIIFYALIFLVFAKFNKFSSGWRNRATLVTIIALALFAGLRGGVGSDTGEYLSYFQRADTEFGARSLFLTLEPIFCLLLIALRYICGDNWFFLFSIASTQALILLYIHKNSQSKRFIFVYALLFYLTLHFNTIRAGIAILLIIAALASKGRKTTFALACVAVGVHISTVIAIPLFFIDKKKNDIKTNAVAIIALAILIYSFYNVATEKTASYDDYLLGSGASIVYSFVMSAIFLVPAILYIKIEKRITVVALALILCYLGLILWPIAYRFIIILQVIYFYLLMEVQTSRPSQKMALLTFWPAFLLVFTLTSISIINEKEKLAHNGAAAQAFDYTTIPYKLYWNDPLVMSD